MQDDARAAELYRAAALAGDGPSQDMLSWMLLASDALTPDHGEALRWALAAAEQGIASAMTRVGMIFHNALGVERDPHKAAEWWRRGARLGDADGQAMLGAACHLGSGVPADPVSAFAWLLRARTGGSSLASRYFDAVKGALSDAELLEAQRRALQPLSEHEA
jgi:TPR repeat protein